MPPRYAYWTILIDNSPTAFRAANREDLQPTFGQLQRTNRNIVMKWFARGRLWDSPEEARAEAQRPRATEKRGHEWRPGGEHKDPRARFDKRKQDHRARRDNDRRPAPPPKPDVARGFSPAPPPNKPFRPSGGRPPRVEQDVRPDQQKPGGGAPFRPGGGETFGPSGGRPFRPRGGQPFRPAGARSSRPGPPRDRRK